MTTPERKKKVYDMLSPRIAQNRKHRRKVANEEAKKGPQAPPKVDNYRVNHPRVARSLNIQPAPVHEKRNIPKTEGMVAVNGKSGEEIQKKAVTKVRPKKKKLDVKDAVIPPQQVKGDKDAKPRRKRTSTKRSSKNPKS